MDKFSINDLSRLIGKFEYEEIDNNWIVKTKIYDKNLNIHINKKDFLNRLNLLKDYNFEDFNLYNRMSNYFELPVRINLKDKDFNLPYEDHLENLKFRIGSPSENYSMYLFLSKGLGPYYGYYVFKHKQYILAKKKSDIQFQDLMSIINNEILKFDTLVIESNSIKDYKEFVKLSNSYLFYLAYNRNLAISLRKNLLDINSKVIYSDCYYNCDQIFGLDLKEEILDYYKIGVASEDPFIQYISFYHVVEYFFEIVTKECKPSQCVIPIGFKGNEEELKNFIKKIFIKKNIGEKNQLLLVLLNFIEQNELKNQLDSVTKNFYEQLKRPLKFAEADPIDEKNFHETLTNRIYTIRNALIHRKEQYKKKYLPFNMEHRQELTNEIPIIRAIATQLILKSSQ
jgi:hypothetical protein